MITPLHDNRRYACPGEPGVIPRSLHLARLAAGFAKCQACEHRRDIGALRPPRNLMPTQVSPPALPLGSLVRSEYGFRGVAVNQLGRHQAIEWAAALAALLWDEVCGWQVVGGGLGNGDVLAFPTHNPQPTTPNLVIGYDERPAAPEVMTGLAMGLERMSCRVIDVGLTTAPCLRFAVQHLNADAGVFVSGSGCDPAWIGFDLWRKNGLPADPTFLDLWQQTFGQPVARPSRSAGCLTAFSAGEAYAASLGSHFHALRPLQVVCGATSPNHLVRLEQVFARLPGRLFPVRLPMRRRDLADPADVDVLRIGAGVREHAAHFGVIIDDDASACGFVDERGELADRRTLDARLIAHLLQGEPGAAVILGTDVWDDLAPAVTSCGGRPVLVAGADRAARLMVEEGLLAVGTDHRLWLGGKVPVCDAIVTLAAVMQLLSRSDAEFSRVAAAA